MSGRLSKKWLIIGISIIFCLAIMLVVISSKHTSLSSLSSKPSYSSAGSSPSTNINPTSVNTISPSITFNSPTPLVPTIFSVPWYGYKDSSFYFAYPQDWQVSRIDSNNITSFKISPKSLYYNPVAPQIVINIYNPSSISTTQRASLLAGVLKTTKGMLAGRQAIELSGQVPAPVVDGISYGAPMKEVHLILQKGTVQYEIIYSYQTSNNEQQAQNIIDKFLSNFKLY